MWWEHIYIYLCSIHIYLGAIVKLQKIAIGIIDKVGYRHFTNQLFIGSSVLKFMEIIYSKTLEKRYVEWWKSVPICIVNMFKLNKIWGVLMRLKYLKWELMSSTDVSVFGVKLWNTFNYELKMFYSMSFFKKTLITRIIKVTWT